MRSIKKQKADNRLAIERRNRVNRQHEGEAERHGELRNHESIGESEQQRLENGCL
jgi:hypothetical protein